LFVECGTFEGLSKLFKLLEVIPKRLSNKDMLQFRLGDLYIFIHYVGCHMCLLVETMWIEYLKIKSVCWIKWLISVFWWFLGAWNINNGLGGIWLLVDIEKHCVFWVLVALRLNISTQVMSKQYVIIVLIVLHHSDVVLVT